MGTSDPDPCGRVAASAKFSLIRASIGSDRKAPAVQQRAIGLIALAIGYRSCGVSEPVEMSCNKSHTGRRPLSRLAVAVSRFPLGISRSLRQACLSSLMAAGTVCSEHLDGVADAKLFRNLYRRGSRKAAKSRWLLHGTTMHGMQLLDAANKADQLLSGKLLASASH